MSISDSDDLDMNLSEPEDDGTSLTNHADLEAALASDAQDDAGGTNNDDILASIDDDPLDLSLGGDADESELEAAFETDTAIGIAPDSEAKASTEEKADTWEDAPENLTGNFTDMAQQVGLDLAEEKPTSNEAPTLTSTFDTPPTSMDRAPETPEFKIETDNDHSVVTTATGSTLKRIVAAITFVVLGGGGVIAILLMGANSRISDLEQRLVTQGQVSSPSAGIEQLELRINSLQSQLEQLSQQPAAAPQEGVELGEFNDKIDLLQAAFEQLSQTIQVMQSENNRPAVVQATPQPETKTYATTGGWSVNIMSFAREQNARKMQQDLAGKGLDTQISASTVNGKTWYRLGITGQANRAEALALRDRLQSEMGLANVWIGRN